MRDRILQVLLDHGTLVEPEAAELILAQKDPMGFLKKYLVELGSTPLILTADDLRGASSLLDFTESEVELPEPSTAKGLTQMQIEPPRRREHLRSAPASAPMPGALPLPAETVSAPALLAIEDLHVISDVTGTSTCDGSIGNFTGYFRDRYRVIRRILRSQVEMGSTMKISDLAHAAKEAKVIGMVMDVSKTKNGHMGVTIEDDTGEIYVLIHKNSELIQETILKDEVLGFVGKPRIEYGNGRDSNMLLATAMHRPSVPLNRPQRHATKDLEVAFMSDIHAGSSHFLDDAWECFVEWMSSPAAAKIQYIVVAGDLVDGIGVYPDQEEELRIQDINKQYEEVARLFADVPERIKIILQPGNHDAVRMAEPQPAIPEDLRQPFGPNFSFIGNPCYFNIAGVEILSYHGRSIDDLVGSIPGVSYSDPVPPMREMVKRRLLAVSYGGRTPLAPEAKDYMVINPVPDILVTGHVHRTAVHREKTMTMINASAWQSQTPFQAMHNFHPDPAKIVVTNLKTGRCKIIDFLGPAK